jgi:hypothetical protein
MLLLLHFFLIPVVCYDRPFEYNDPEGLPYLVPQEPSTNYNIGISFCVQWDPIDGTTVYREIAGMLTQGDCGALYYQAAYLAEKWKAGIEASAAMNRKFRYVETGSFNGLSTHIVASALRDTLKSSNYVVYAHDLFDHISEVSLVEKLGFWDRHKGQHQTKLEKFYSDVLKGDFEGSIIPVPGASSR